MNFFQLMNFHQHLWKEVESIQTDQLVKHYYRNILQYTNKRWFYAFNWSRRLENLTKEINKGSIILDAACGLGTESLCASFCGASVLGVDLNKDFIKTAIKRKLIYEKIFEKPLNVIFENKNIFNLEYRNHFDIIWCMEAISHIYPTEKFLKVAHSVLKPGGKILISDPNAANLIIQLKLIKEVGLKRGRVKRIDPQTNKEIEESCEKILVPSKLKKMMKENGFVIEKINYSIFLPPILFSSFKAVNNIYKLEKILNKIPIIRSMGAIYTIVGVKK